MKDSVNVNAILNSAIEREEESYAFYTDVARQMHDQAIKDTFQELAKDELGHKDFIKKCMKDQNLLRNLPVPQDWKLAEATEGPIVSEHMKPKDAIALAMKREQEAAELYTKLVAWAVNSEYREMFKGLATVELGHKAHLESVFVSIGFPEAW